MRRTYTILTAGKTASEQIRKGAFHMKKRFKVLGIIALAVAVGFSLAGCDNGTTKVDGVEDGNLAGSGWQRKASSSSYNFTYTYTFTSSNAGEYNQTGWGMVGSQKQNYNVTTNFTYIYEGAVNRIGVITQGGSQLPFSVSQDYQTLTVSGAKYTRK
jgi:hypothetical protein